MSVLRMSLQGFGSFLRAPTTLDARWVCRVTSFEVCIQAAIYTQRVYQKNPIVQYCSYITTIGYRLFV